MSKNRLKKNISGMLAKTSFPRRQYIILLGFAILPLLFVMIIALPLAQRALQTRTQQQMDAAATLLEVETRSWLDEGRYAVLELARNNDLHALIQAYRQQPSAELQDDIRARLQDTVHAALKIDGVAVLIPDQPPLVYPDTVTFTLPSLSELGIVDIQSVTEKTMMTVQTSKGTLLFVAIEPIRDDKDQVEALAISLLDLNRVSKDLQFVAQVLESGQVFLVTPDGFVLTALSNTSADAYKTAAIKTASQSIRALQTDTSPPASNDDKMVMETHRWLDEAQLGIVLTVNRSVMQASIQGMVGWVVVLVLLMIGLAIFFARLLNKWLSAPLIQLTQAASAFEQGNFSYRITSFFDDEFGQVATAINHMADSLEASYSGLEQQVAEKTAELSRTNERLSFSEELSRVAFQTIRDSITVTRLRDGLYINVNEGFEHITGYSAAETIGKTSLDIDVWCDPAERNEMVRILREQGHIQDFQARFRRKDGTSLIGLVSATVVSLFDEPHLVMQARDITHRKEMELALRDSEARYRDIFENSPISLWEEDYSDVKTYLQDLEARVPDVAEHLRNTPEAVEACIARIKIINVNQATLSIFGAAEKAQLIPDGLRAIILPETLQPFAEQIIALWENKPVFSMEQHEQTLSKQRIYVRVSISVAPGYQESWKKVFISVLDMTAQRHSQQAVQRRNEELSVLNRVIAASAMSAEESFMFDTACRELAKLFNVPRAVTFMFDTDHGNISVITEYLEPDAGRSLLGIEIPMQNNAIVRYLVTNQAPMLVEDLNKDARLAEHRQLLNKLNISALVLCPLMVDGRVVGALGVGADEPRHFSAQDINLIWSVSDQVSGVLARIRLTQTHRRLVTAVEQLEESIIITEFDGSILDVNPAFEKITGYSRAEVIGKHINSLAPESFGIDRRRERWEVIAQGKLWQGRTLTQTQSGKIITEEEVISPLRNPQREIIGFVVVRRDVTRELELEEQYYQAQKMEAIGRLTGGVAHDFNNLLTAINGFAELLQRRLKPDDWQYNMVANILSSGQRATNLVRQLLVFSRKQTANPQVMNLNFAMNDIQKMLQRVIGEHIEIETTFDDDLWNIKADPTQIEQIIVNLAVNARDAMPDGGTLALSTQNIVIEPEYIRPDLPVPAGKYVRLAVSDTGTGIAEDVRNHIFEPFFSTKESGKGTGLGLATVYGIIQQHGGFINFTSELGQGTTFLVYLPATKEVEGPSLANDDLVPEDLSGSETILVVEDEDSVRAMAVDVLRQFGYHVYVAANGLEGLETAGTHMNELDLVLTDVIMPKLNGKLMADKLKQENPALRIVFMSGYMGDIITDHSTLQANGAFLEKPFTPTKLLTFIRRALDAKNNL